MFSSHEQTPILFDKVMFSSHEQTLILFDKIMFSLHLGAVNTNLQFRKDTSEAIPKNSTPHI